MIVERSSDDRIHQMMIRMHELQHDECRSDSEADCIAEAVQLCAEIRRLICESRSAAIEHIEEHGKENQLSCRNQFDTLEVIRAHFGGDGDCSEPARSIAQRQQCRQHRKDFSVANPARRDNWLSMSVRHEVSPRLAEMAAMTSITDGVSHKPPARWFRL